MQARPGPSTPSPKSPAKVTIAVASGKGGVGKSTVSLNLGLALAQRGYAVGLVDADVYGPDIPRMLNLARKEWLHSWTLWRRSSKSGGTPDLKPISKHGLKVMSTGFLIAEDQPLNWEASMIELALHQIIHDVDWGPLDYLIIDLPPGTADLQQRLMNKVQLTGALIVVTPQDLAHLDAKKVLTMFRNGNVKILGGVENMEGLVCPHCSERFDLFPKVTDERSVWSLGIDKLGSVPMDPIVASSGDLGLPVILGHADSPAAEAFRNIAEEVSNLAEESTSQ
jgi:ATP-binding protein involved in chromosome partitioning